MKRAPLQVRRSVILTAGWVWGCANCRPTNGVITGYAPSQPAALAAALTHCEESRSAQDWPRERADQITPSGASSVFRGVSRWEIPTTPTAQ